LARAARERGVPAYVVMPRTAPRAKQAAVAGYGAEISFCDAELASREATLREVIARTDARFIHPFDDARVIAGQGTAALELFSDVPDLDAVLAPVGGGGLLSGTAIVARGSRADVRIIGVEPELADDAWQSLREGRVVPPRPPRTVADGLLTALSELTFSILRETGAEIVRVSEREILESMRLLWERAKLVVEPSGAVPVAAALAGRADLRGRRVGVILSGGNVDLCRNELCNFWRP
jgi:threonine dehydratase